MVCFLRRRIVVLRVVFFFLVLLVSSAAHAGKRVALVIGNSGYRYASELTNPKNDAADVTAALERHGFIVISGLDLNKAGLDQKIRDFERALRGSEVGLFFYAGHGLQVAGQNYIVPTDAQLSSPAALESEMMRIEIIQQIMESEDRTNILFLDACRDNPMARNLAQAMGTRSTAIGRGLAPVESGYGTLISFSTQPGNIALDGTGRNSPYSSALVKHMSSSNDDLSAILIAVRNDVMRETQRRQVPWEHSSLTSRVYFKTSPGGVVPPPPPLRANPGAAERSQIALEQGRAAYQKGDLDRAIADLNEAIRLDPKSVAAFNHRGMAYNDKGDFDRAIVDYSEVTRLNPRWAGAFNNRGFTYKNKNDFDRAIADYNEAIKLDAKYAITGATPT
jgi:uncharacterized caspase-like protein